MKERGALLIIILLFLISFVSAEVIDRGSYWEKIDNNDETYSIKIYNTIINYYNGSTYVPFSYGSCGSNCFRDWNGLIYRVSNDPNRAYIDLYDINDNYISSFGFGITGTVGGTNYQYSTLNFTWTWWQQNTTENEYIFKAWNGLSNFNWTQEYHFYSNQSMKIKNRVENNLGVSIENAKFWYIQTLNESDGIWFNGTRFVNDTYHTGEFDGLLPQVRFEDYYIFKYGDLLNNSFNITDFYLGDGSIIGVSDIRILAIGITKGASILPNGVGVTLDPTITIQGSEGGDAYVRQDKPTTNYGSDNNLLIAEGSSERNSYLKFNISVIPENQKVDNATICLYLYKDEGSQNISAYHVYEDWQEDIITWSNQPCGASFDNSSACNLIAESNLSNDGNQDGTWQCWNITNMVEQEYNQNNKSVSTVLRTINIGNADEFYSKEYSDSSLWPYLNITYHVANTAPIITLTEPKNKLYTYNESLDLNFSVLDDDGNLDSCWYSLDGGNNISLASCANTTFNTSEGSHELVLYANDTNALESSSSVDFNVDLIGVSISISEPSGTKTTRTGIPINYVGIGNNLTCWYNVKTSIGGAVIENTTLANCSNSSFDVSTDGDYILNLYVNNSLGSFSSDNSSFSISTTQPPPSSGGGGGGGSSHTTIITTNGTTELSLEQIQDLIVEPGDIEELSWSVKNTGTSFLNDCKVRGEGGYSYWISSDELKSLAAGEKYDFSFNLKIPETSGEGQYTLTLSLVCQEISEYSSFIVEILGKKFFFDLIKVERESVDTVKIVYSLEELSGSEQNIELQFLLFDPNNEKTAEIRETKLIPANSKEEFEISIQIDPSLEGELNLLVNLNSEAYSTFTQENIVLGAPIGGLAIFGDATNTDNLITGVLTILFLVFAFFIVKRIFSHRKKLGKKSKKLKNIKKSKKRPTNFFKKIFWKLFPKKDRRGIVLVDSKIIDVLKNETSNKDCKGKYVKLNLKSKR